MGHFLFQPFVYSLLPWAASDHFAEAILTTKLRLFR